MTPSARVDLASREWRVCIECGDRYVVGRQPFYRSWCSPSCQEVSMRRQRDEIYKSLPGAYRWIL